MPFDFKIAPGIFDRAMEALPATLKWKSVRIYVDSVLIFFQDARGIQCPHEKSTHSFLQNAEIPLKSKKLVSLPTLLNMLNAQLDLVR